MILPDDVFRIGTIGRPHGLGGEVTLHFTDDVFDRVDAEYLIIEVDGILVPFFMESYRFRTDTTAIVKFCDIDTVEQARQLNECTVFFPRSLSDSDDETVSTAEIIGFEVVNATNGERVGRIVDIDQSTINTLLSVARDDGSIVLLPFSDDLFVNIDTNRRQLTLKIAEGLLDI